MNRRNFLVSGAAGAIAQILPPSALGQNQDFWSQPRSLWLYRKETNENVLATYFANGKVIEPEYKKLCMLLRDVRASQAVEMSMVLLDILTGIQGWLLANGIQTPLYTNSGYRSPHTNANIEGAARNSKHMSGGAWDGRVPQISTESLARFAIYLQGGGVGFYQARGFIHIDDGNKRFWRGK